MPTAPLRPCAGGCGALVLNGKCAQCARQGEQRRGSAASRGYDRTWERFRQQFVGLLIEQGITPACGATLPGGPRTQDSFCQGRVTTEALHFDHDPPLQDYERQNPRAVCDPLRIQLLCAEDHNRKTRREQAGYHRPSTVATGIWVVTGPPGSGKTTWVEQQRRPGDVVWDADAIATVLAHEPTFPRSPHVLMLLQAMRDTVVRELEAQQTQTAYLIVTDHVEAGRIATRLRGQIKRFDVIHSDRGVVECL